MKQRQFITAFSLIVVLSGLSPVVAADVAGEEVRHAHSQSEPVPPQKIELTAHQMDAVTGGGLGLPGWAAKALFCAIRITCSNGSCTMTCNM